MRSGIDSISVAPDSFAAVKHHVAAAERDAHGRNDATTGAGPAGRRTS
ncbi:hypothetical protein [Streptomyces sp. NPDC057545]